MFCFSILLFLHLSIVLSYAFDKNVFDPWEFNNARPSEKVIGEKEGISPLANLFIQGVRFYQRFMSPVKAHSCPMYPSCSAYSIEAIKKHGALVGFVMTADRLIHESNEMDHAPLFLDGNTAKYYDPVSNNDFWWHNEKKTGKVVDSRHSTPR